MGGPAISDRRPWAMSLKPAIWVNRSDAWTYPMATARSGMLFASTKGMPYESLLTVTVSVSSGNTSVPDGESTVSWK
ncbi:MAG: hypothetical protein BWX71_01789 [Deltaproteobacteria bacterium ADurb.Bin072]|nr:MAG: hypothetical protein BWX71_01789 [Deltaproteobacteria bacterium ADurb.Bin072]